tara:strand:+ start:393 stop:575 length:183 start_codon:yes stop_codon:yes gene_type:complete
MDMEDDLHQMARHYMNSMKEKHIDIRGDYSLDEFIDKWAIKLTMEDLYLGQLIIRMFNLI